MKFKSPSPEKNKDYNDFIKKGRTIPDDTFPQEIPKVDWRDKYPRPTEIKSYRLEDSADDSTLNRMIQLKSFNKTDIIIGKPGALYFDKENGKVKIFIDEATGWKNLAFEP